LKVYRCEICKKGLDCELTQGIPCPVCGERKWRLVKRLTWMEMIRLWRQTGVVFLDEQGWLGRRIASRQNKKTETNATVN